MHDSPSSTMEIFQSILLANNKYDDDAGTVRASVQRIRSSSLRSSSSASLIVLVGMLLLVVEGCWSFVIQNHHHQYQYNSEYENEKCKGGRRCSIVLSAVDVESTMLGATMSSNLKGREFVDQMIMKNSTESAVDLEVIAQKAAGNGADSSGSNNIQSNEDGSRSNEERGDDVDEYSEESSSTAAAADASDGSGSDGDDDDDDDNNGGTPQRPTIADRTKFFRKRGLGQLQQKLARSRQPGRSEAAKQKQESKTVKRTSVGERRVGSASRARQGGKRISGGIMDVIRKTATGTGATKKQQESSSTPSPTASPKKDSDANDDKPNAAATSPVVQSTIEEILEKQRSRIEELSNKENQLFQQLHRAGASSGVNKYVGITSWEEQVMSSPVQPQKRVSTVPKPGTVLVKPSHNHRVRAVHHGQRVTVRVGTSLDDFDIANLRLSVFSDFTPQVRKQFCARSCNAIVKRRMQGATCLVATVPRRAHGAAAGAGAGAADGVDSSRSRNSNIIIGSAECSFHEFRGTELGRRRPADSILYVTEVAVNPNFRRCGIGAKLMKGIDKIAKLRKIETVFLHVDVSNHAAIALYERAGYRRVDSEFDPMFFHFTKSLNLHDGATKGRNHYLLCKDLVSDPTWNDVSALGFEIPK